MGKTRFIHRKAGNGQFTTQEYAKRHPGTTIRQRVLVKKPSKKGK